MKPTSKKWRTPLLPPAEEWDFRMIQPDPGTLQTAIEYEYVRSSNLRQVIEAWHTLRLSQVRLLHDYSLAKAFFNAGIVETDFTTDISVEGSDMEGHLRHYEENSVRFDEAKKRNCTIGEFIEQVFLNRPRAGLLHTLDVLDTLKRRLPIRLVRSGAEHIALRYDRFPEPWLKLSTSYVADRSDRVLNDADCIDPDLELELPFREIHHLFDQTADVCEQPGIFLKYFVVDFNAGPIALEAAFKSWLSDAFRSRQPGRRNQEGWLQRLAAYRLSKAGLTEPRAREIIAQRKSSRPGANIDALNTMSAPNWSRAVKRAEQDLKSDFIRNIRASFNKLTFRNSKSR